MVLHLTKKLADKLKLAPKVEPFADEFLSWRANYVQEHGQRFVVFMNDASRFTVVINEAKAAKLKKLPELFFAVLRDTLLAIGVNPEVGRYGLPVRRFRAFDINVRLDLDGKDAIRRLRVPAYITFEQLHRILQAAFHWRNYHLYSFGLFKEWSEKYYARPDIELASSGEDYNMNPDAKPMAGVSLSGYMPEYRKILYTYDYGDDWRHYIEIENIINDCDEDLPVLLSGEGDSPPEDVGGPGGFADFLEVIANREHEEYEHLTAWAKSQRWCPFDFEDTARDIRNKYY